MTLENDFCFEEKKNGAIRLLNLLQVAWRDDGVWKKSLAVLVVSCSTCISVVQLVEEAIQVELLLMSIEKSWIVHSHEVPGSSFGTSGSLPKGDFERARSAIETG